MPRMITCLDDQVGRIVAALEKKGLRDNTIIFFASDNGGATSALFATGAQSKEEREERGGIGLRPKPPAPMAICAAARAASTKAAFACPHSSTGRASSSPP